LNTSSHIRCSLCRFVREDPEAGERDWTAYECGNPDSEYHKALLNVRPNGDKQQRVTWGGCPCGEEARP
jgi:hypothetical protein